MTHDARHLCRHAQGRIHAHHIENNFRALSARHVLDASDRGIARKGTSSAPRSILRDGGVEPLRLRPRSPNLNAFAERWVRSVKEECLSRLILFGEASLRRALNEYVAHFDSERNHQGKGNILLFPQPGDTRKVGPVACSQRVGGLLRYYGRAA